MISKQVILKWFLTPLMLLGLSIASLAQNIQIKGKVIDAETKQALEAATVLVKGQSLSVRTDANGLFAINNVPNKASIVVSYVGYQTQSVTASAGDLVVALVKSNKTILYSCTCI